MNQIQQQLFLRGWKNNRQKIHEYLRKQSQWNNYLKDFSWRIDTKSKSKQDPKQEFNDPTAILQLLIGPHKQEGSLENDSDKNNDNVVRFEMDRQKLLEVQYQVNQIQNQINKFSKNNN